MCPWKKCARGERRLQLDSLSMFSLLTVRGGAVLGGRAPVVMQEVKMRAGAFGEHQRLLYA